MIQRKQTVFLLIAGIALTMAAIFNTGSIAMLVILIVAALIAFGAIFLYTNRPLQAKLAVADIFLLIAWYILLAVVRVQPLYEGGGGDSVAVTQWFTNIWFDVLPMIAILMLFLARNGIVKDEKLVRSLDRIR